MRSWNGRGSSFLRAREKRVHPHKDDKVLTDWNGLMIAALARGAQVLGERRYAEAAKKALRFITDRMAGENGRILHRYRDGEASIPANLDDYAFLVWGLIELYEATFDTRIPRSRPFGSTAINWRISGTRPGEASFSLPMTARSFCFARRMPMTAPCRRATRWPCSTSCGWHG